MITCSTFALWLSLTSIHIIDNDHNYNGLNPGFSVQCDQFEAGLYKNSLRNTSGFVGWKGQVFMAGVATGYSDLGLTPYIAAHINIQRLEVIAMPFVESTKNMTPGLLLALRFQL